MAKAFDLCRRRGLVSKEVLADSAKLMPEILNATLVAEGIQGCLDQNLSTNFSLLPLDWTRNLPTKVQVSSKPLLASK